MHVIPVLFLLSLASFAFCAEVELKIHSELNAYEYYSRPLPDISRAKDGTLSVWHLAHSTGSNKIVEGGPKVAVKEQHLSLCYTMRPIVREPNAPIPAVAIPVVLEFRVSGLTPDNYKVQEVSICN